jgi:hypothetical protein
LLLGRLLSVQATTQGVKADHVTKSEKADVGLAQVRQGPPAPAPCFVPYRTNRLQADSPASTGGSGIECSVRSWDQTSPTAGAEAPSKDARTRLSGATWGKRSQVLLREPTRTEAKLGPNQPVQRPTRGQLSPCRWHSLAKSNPRQRFRNGLSVAAYVWRLTCCFILITGGRTCGDFASASRFACTSSEACAHCAMSALDLRSSCVTVPRY